MATTKKAETTEPKVNRYFVLNPGGAIHEVTREHAAQLFKNPGFRKPTAAQVKTYLAAKLQRHDKPIGEKWSSDPGEGVDVDSLGMETPQDE